jgi:Holliday junction resolvase RusA-like endonuclease
MIKFILPFPPTSNKLYPTVGLIRTKSDEYKKWINEANIAANRQNVPIMTERCIAVYNLNHPDDRVRDAENYTKAITDLLAARGIIQDDNRRYLKGTFALWNDEEGDQVEVKLYTLDEFTYTGLLPVDELVEEASSS